ncbi:MAG TPA: hypothetical protein VFV84_14775 [Burkholderiales bacterium]|nr:hypothetical protein [Burkholderiales bacterium]
MRTLVAILAGGMMLVVAPFALAQAKPAAKPAAAAAAPKGPTPEEKAMDRAVANYNKNKPAMNAKAGKK